MARKVKEPFCKKCGTQMVPTEDPLFRFHCPTCNLGCHTNAEKLFIDFREKQQ